MIFISYLRHSEGQESNVPIHGLWYPWGSGKKTFSDTEARLVIEMGIYFNLFPSSSLSTPHPAPKIKERCKAGFGVFNKNVN